MKCTVLRNERLSPEVFRLELTRQPEFRFRPGQALKLRVPDLANPGVFLDRYFSIASPPESESLELCIKTLGAATAFLANLAEGDVVEADGPVGQFVLQPDPTRHFVFISIGTGIAPFRSMVLSDEYRRKLPLSTTLIAGFRAKGDILFNEEFMALDYVSWIPALSQGVLDGSFQGRVTSYLSEASIPYGQGEFYICGSADLVKEVRAILLQKGVGEQSIHHEPYLYPKKSA